MPKTNEKDAYFFSHDCNARNDPKILGPPLRLRGGGVRGVLHAGGDTPGSSRSTGCQ